MAGDKTTQMGKGATRLARQTKLFAAGGLPFWQVLLGFLLYDCGPVDKVGGDVCSSRFHYYLVPVAVRLPIFLYANRKYFVGIGWTSGGRD